MDPDQSEVGKVVLKTLPGVPGRLTVAVLALAQRTLMRIVRLMTAGAFNRQRRVEAVAVTAAAAGFGMRAEQGETGLLQMVEGSFPTALIVAACAVRAVPAEMHVVAGVTADAAGFERLEPALLHVTVAAAEQRVRRFQDESGSLAVIEPGIRPAGSAVAVGAGGTVAALVNVVDPMTVCALAGLPDPCR